MYGVIKRLTVDKGFGFIEPSDRRDQRESKDFFFHRSACEPGEFEMLHEGAYVSFDPTKSDKGPRAERVNRAAVPASTGGTAAR